MNKGLACITFLILLSSAAHSSFTSAGDIKDHTTGTGTFDAHLKGALLRIYVVKDHIIRIRYTREDRFSEAPSYAVSYKGGTVPCTVDEKPGFFEITTKSLKVKVTKSPCRIAIYDTEGRLLNEDERNFGVMWDSDEVRCHKRLFADEQFFGLGEKTGPLGRRGSQYTMWNTDYPQYPKEVDSLYVSIPFFIGVRDFRAYGIFFDNTYRSHFCMGAGNDRFYWFGADKGEMDYYFIQGPAMKDVISSYTELTGRMEMPPLWSLGFQQSRWSYPTEKIVRSIAHGFRSRSIPCDVIYLDIDYMNGYRVFTWDKTRFPEPEKMIADLGKDGFKIIPIIDPGVKADDTYFAAREGIDQGLFAKYPDGVPYKGEVWPSWAYFPDFTLDKTRAWWGEKLSKLMAQGVAGFWIDMNEPAVWGRYVPDIVQFHDEGFKADHKKIHNVYALQMAKATREGWKKNSAKRPFVLTRAGFAGTQRYAAVWTGDNIASEEHLLLACTMPQSMGLSGLSFTGTDVGGFTGMPSANLYVRWMQLGVFTPFFRAHSIIDTPDKEPWALGETVEKLSREAITMRYRFLPFLYTEFYNSSRTGLPIMQPLFLNFQDDKECYKDDAQKAFMIGDHLLVAPVLSEKEMTKKLYLPEGKWMGWWDNKVYEGKRWITVDAPLSRIPLFLKAGAIIPMQAPMQYVGEKKLDTMEFAVFPKDGVSYTLYEDEGDGYGYKEGAYSLTRINIKKAETMSISISTAHDGHKGTCTTYLLRLCASENPARISAQGKDLAKCEKEEQLSGMKEGYFYDAMKKCLVIKVGKMLPLAVSIE